MWGIPRSARNDNQRLQVCGCLRVCGGLWFRGCLGVLDLGEGHGWPGEDGHGGGVGGDGGGVDPRDALLDGEVIYQIAGFEVVGGVEDEMGGAEEVVDVGGDEIGDVGGEGDGGVGGEEFAASGFGFGDGIAGVLFVEEDLALEVGGFDEVAVDEDEMANAGAGRE